MESFGKSRRNSALLLFLCYLSSIVCQITEDTTPTITSSSTTTTILTPSQTSSPFYETTTDATSTTRTFYPTEISEPLITVVDGCNNNVCPENVTCHDNGNYCACKGNFKGINCSSPDALIQCEGNTTFQYDNITETSQEIICFDNPGNPHDYYCVDSDDDIVYLLDTNSLLYMDGPCLMVNRSEINTPEYCVFLTAVEKDDRLYRPYRSVENQTICVTFNEPPVLESPIGDSIVNMNQTRNQGDEILTVNIYDTLGSQNPSIRILDASKLNTFAMTGNKVVLTRNLTEDEYISPILNVAITIQVEDNGQPSIAVDFVLKLTFIANELHCDDLPTVYLTTFSSNATTVQISCNVPSSLLLYSIQGNTDSGLYVTYDDGSISIITRNPFPYVVYNIELLVEWPYGEFSLPWLVKQGEPPTCGVINNLAISEDKDIIKCHQVTSCSYFTDDPKVYCNITNQDPKLVSLIDVNCTTSIITGTNDTQIDVFLCNSQPIYQQNASGFYQVSINVWNEFDVSHVIFDLEIVKGNFFEPVFSSSNYKTTISEDALIGTTVVLVGATDGDGDILTFSVQDPNVPFVMDGNQVVLNGSLDAALRNFYQFEIKVLDYGNREDFANVSITVEDVNEAPVCQPSNFTVSAVAATSTVIGQVICIDKDLPPNGIQSYSVDQMYSDWFQITNDGNLMVQKLPLTLDVITITVYAHDSGNLNASSRITIFIDKYIPAACQSLDNKILIIGDDMDNSTIMNITSCTNPLLTAVTIRSVSGYGSSLFKIEIVNTSSSFLLRMYPAIDLVHQQGLYNITVTLTNGYNETDVTINIQINEINDPPKFSMDLFEFSVLENVAIGSSLGVVSAVDPDLETTNNVITYSISAPGNTTGEFSIDAATGLIQLNTALNASKTSVFAFQIKATDPHNTSDIATVHIKVVDVNDPPMCDNRPNTFNVSLDDNAGKVLGKFICWDYDVNVNFLSILYRVEDKWKDVFGVDSSGEFFLQSRLPVTQNNSLQITVFVYDNVGFLAFNLTASVKVNTTVPPVCKPSRITKNLTEKTPIGSCLGAEVSCGNPINSLVSILEVKGSGTHLARTKVRENNNATTLPVNVCTNSSLQGKTGNYNVIATIGNGFATTSVQWDFVIEDINDPPVFIGLPYEVQILETTPVQEKVLSVSFSDPDSFDLYRTVRINSVKEINGQGDISEIEFLNNRSYFSVRNKLNATERNIYKYTIEIIDGGNLTASTNATIHIEDVNEPPICSQNFFTASVSLIDPVGTQLVTVSCYDTDILPQYRSLTFTIKSDIFGITNDGTLVIASPLPRNLDKHNLSVSVSDGKFNVTVTVDVNVNRAISASCAPTLQNPNVWVQNACFDISMNCQDPTLAGVSHIQYSLEGNFSSGFSTTKDSGGNYSFCYSLTTSGMYQVLVSVNNGLKTKVFTVDIPVIYDQSNPVFQSSQLSAQVQENIPLGSVILTVRALDPKRNGTIVYSFIGDYGPFLIDRLTGMISLASPGLRDYSNTVVKLEIQAENEYSKLKAMATLEVTVDDVNEKPVCNVTVNADGFSVQDSIGKEVMRMHCQDPDVKPSFKTLTASLAVTPEQLANTFILTNESSSVFIVKTEKLFSVNEQTYQLKVSVKDVDTNPLEEVVIRDIVVDLTPPLPDISVKPHNSTSLEVYIKYQRTDFYLVTQSFDIKAVNGSEVKLLTVNPDASVSTYFISGLNEKTDYMVTVLVSTTFGVRSSQPIRVTLPATPVYSNAMVSFKVTQIQFSPLLLDPNSFVHVSTKNNITTQLKTYFKKKYPDSDIRIEIVSFRKGSVIVDLAATMDNSNQVSDVLNTFSNEIETGWIENLAVDPTYFVTSNGDGYIRVTSLTSNLTHIGHRAAVKFTCVSTIVGTVGNIGVRWTRNNILINPTPNSRWILSSAAINQADPNTRTFYLEVSPIFEVDSGNLTCVVFGEDNVVDDQNLNVKVIMQPKSELKPRTQTIIAGEAVNVTCLVTHPLDEQSVFTWYKDGVKIESNDNEITVTIAYYAERLFVKQVNKTTQYSCEASNNGGLGNRAFSHIFVVVRGASVCPETVDVFGTVWPESPSNTVIYGSCRKDENGTSQRTCNENGLWDPPDYSDCTRNTLITLQDETEQTASGVPVISVEQSLTEMETLTKDNSSYELSDSELKVSVNILSNIVKITKENVSKINNKSFEAFVNTFDNLLGDQNRPKWKNRIKKNEEGVAGLMKVGNDFLSAGTDLESGDFEKVVKRDNIVVRVGKSGVKDLNFPEANLNVWQEDKVSTGLLTKEALTKLNQVIGSDKVGYSNILYRNIDDYLHPYLTSDSGFENISNKYDVNSDVLDFTLDGYSSTMEIDPPIAFTFKHFSTNFSNPKCVFWDYDVPNTPNGAWSSRGCVLVSTSDSETKCECNHLTNFALLMSPGKTPESHILALSIISGVGCGVSTLFLIITMICYGLYWRYVKSDKAIILMNLCLALIIAYTIFLVGVNRTENKDVCTAIAALLHYIWLAVFFIMLAEGIEMAVLVLYVFSTRSRTHWLMPLMWISPAVVVAISLGVTKTEGYGTDTYCWLTLATGNGVLWAFVGPVLLIIVVNIIIITLVLKALLSTQTMLTKTTREQAKASIKSLAVLIPVTGATWILGVFSVNESLVVFQYVFAIINSFQGFFIFLFHCLLNKQLKDAIKHNRRRRRSKAEFSKSSHSTSNAKNTQKESLEKINNSAENRKENLFWEADRHVQQLVDKLKKGDDNKAYNHSDEDEATKDNSNVLSIDDVKISNLLKENSQENLAKTSTTDSKRQELPYTGLRSTMDRYYDHLTTNDIASKSSNVKPPEVSRKPSSLDKESRSYQQPSRESTKKPEPKFVSKFIEPEPKHSSTGSSNARVSNSGSRASSVENPRKSQSSSGKSSHHRSQENLYDAKVNIKYAAAEAPYKQSQIYSGQPQFRTTISTSAHAINKTDDERMYRERYQRDEDYYDQGKKKSDKSKSQKRKEPKYDQYGDPYFGNAPAGSYERRIQEQTYLGASKPRQSSKKEEKRPSSRDRHDRQQYERWRKYAVADNQTYNIQPSKHSSLENVSMQYVGFQPFGGIRSYDNMRPQQRGRDPGYSSRTAWREPRADYW